MLKHFYIVISYVNCIPCTSVLISIKPERIIWVSVCLLILIFSDIFIIWRRPKRGNKDVGSSLSWHWFPEFFHILSPGKILLKCHYLLLLRRLLSGGPFTQGICTMFTYFQSDVKFFFIMIKENIFFVPDKGMAWLSIWSDYCLW